MKNEPSQVPSQLFRVRVWSEDIGSGRTEYRGRVLHVVSGDARHFRDWATLEAFLMSKIRGQAERS